ncbi:MAG TPA: 4'-phosphopantetheinyl transferase superfamily protein [Steroidobacteraceae bacterium]|nr:4'-phosphopantetheinyl transferase superfamily protein [Steroidobacteraceae bacterium]
MQTGREQTKLTDQRLEIPFAKVSTQSQFPANPAHVSPRVQSLFPAGVVVVEMVGPGDPSMLYPGEAEYLGRAVPKRIQEFSAGRLCARLALAAFGIVEFALRVAQDRQPVWPVSVVGSISHTAGFCVAAVAEKNRLRAIGVDCEVVGHVGADLWASIFTPREALWVDSLPEPERPGAAALIFSAKEAFYKCQYPLTGEWLDFHDLDVEPQTWGGLRGGFLVRATRPLAVTELTHDPAMGQYLFHDGLVTTGMAVAVEASARRDII